MSIFPKEVEKRSSNPRFAGQIARANAVGVSASFVCGAFVRLMMLIDAESKKIGEAKFISNGCGFMVAVADTLAEHLRERRLTELNGVSVDDLKAAIEQALGPFPQDRVQCLQVAIESAKQALANHRSFIIEEFAGEKALICTCFGVSEDEIESVIRDSGACSVEMVADACRAGTGCGACRMMIQEMIDLPGTV
ncbi:MAG TPA: iron-sulfur cluster assembly scaffold protein [Pyrinomonadaceae bacterium]|nr:iron-sulfur cluster assembly scaffold protein [Pyrinomonadaceae bacterium]